MAVSPHTYDRDYFLSGRCEGYEYFRAGELSLVRKYEIGLLRLEPGLRLLDAGCGRGEVLRACAQAGAKVAGIDYSEAAVELTRQTLVAVEEADVRRGEVTALPWPDDSFDRILCGDVIEHLDPSQANVALSEFRRVLRPGGMLLLHTAPNVLFRRIWPVLRPFVRLAGAREAAETVDDYLEDLLAYHVNELSLGGLRRMVCQADFVKVRAWINPDVIRSGSHRFTRGMDRSRLFAIAARIAGSWPLILFLGNDIYATGEKPATS
jgi:ubiquinone/menaquinone biosynthesis C-methylase UbiE